MPPAMPNTPRDQRERAAPAAAQARISPGGEPEQGERDEAADEVVAGRGAGLRLQEVVVEHVQRDQGDRDEEEDVLAGPPAPPRARRGLGGGGWRQRWRSWGLLEPEGAVEERGGPPLVLGGMGAQAGGVAGVRELPQLRLAPPASR